VVWPPDEATAAAREIETYVIPKVAVRPLPAMGYAALYAGLAAALWGALSGVTGFRVPWLSLSIGWVAAAGVLQGGRGRVAQIIATAIAFLAYMGGMALMSFVWTVQETQAFELSFFLQIVFALTIQTFTSFQLIDLGITLWLAWSLPGDR
jgi:hypothetical protein